jgi:outer membrane protein insertion porin family
VLLCALACLAALPAWGQLEGEAIETAAEASGGDAFADGPATVVVLPFRIHSARPLEHLAEALPELLSTRLEGTAKIEVVDRGDLRAAMPDGLPVELSDSQLRGLAERLSASAVVAGSLTELAGRYSLDIRVTPAQAGNRSHTLVLTAESEKELIGGLGELSEQVLAVVSGADPGRIVGLDIQGAGGLEPELRAMIESQAGTRYDPSRVRADRDRVEALDQVARVTVNTDRNASGVLLTFAIVRSEMILGGGGLQRVGETVAEIEIRGNRRIEAEAIRRRIGTEVGDPLSRSRLARDVREVYGLGWFQNVYVFAEDGEDGLRLIFEVEENAVIRQISISGNDNLDADKIKDILTLTTGSTVDHPLLHENTDRIRQLYRAEGYYLADVDFTIEEITDGSVSVDFAVNEGEKLKLREVSFEGNEALSDKDLLKGFSTKTWKFYSPVSSWFDHSGTYSEPIFARDLRESERQYTDSGYLQVEIDEPEVDATEEGLFVRIKVREGPEFSVGEIDVGGDDTVDLEALRDKLKLSAGDVFNRSYLTQDVEALEQHYTDRGFYFASVQPQTRLSEEAKTVDVKFVVEKGPLYFVRNINISGNTRTIDPVIRREMKVVEGQLYSARGIQLSTTRIRRLGYFEDVAFEPQPTEDPSQLDLNVNVVERPTGSFSFGAGYSSQDKLVFNASLSQSNLFGRGYFVNVSVDVGGQTNRYFIQLSDPYFLGSQFSFSTTAFVTDVVFDTFQRYERGFTFAFGHALSEDNRTRGSLHYNFASRRIIQPINAVASAPIYRELLQGNESSSRLGVTYTRDTRDDRFTATKGTNLAVTMEYSGLGGFAKFFRTEARFAWYMGAPDWMFDRSTFVFATRFGYALPLNTIADYDLRLVESGVCDDPSNCQNVQQLDHIDTDIVLPLTERYFLGGIGNWQLRGYRARTVGPRRAILNLNEGLNVFHPVGTVIAPDDVTGTLVATCVDDGSTAGNRNGVCNHLNTRNIEEFNDLLETDVVGGSSFISTSFEYRFPISEQVGLQGVFFVDGGNAFAENQNPLDVTQWRWGYGGGVLWFSPFGPLQLILGFPVNPLAFEESPVFEFSVGGFGL